MPDETGTCEAHYRSRFKWCRSKKKSLTETTAPEAQKSEDLPPSLQAAPEQKTESPPSIRPVSGAREGKSSRKFARIPNLNELAATHQQPEKETESEELGEYYGEKPFTSEELKAAWDHFARERKAAGKDVEYAVLTQDFYLRDNHTIVLQLTNSVKIPILDRFRSDLITHLKSTLDNRHIQLETELLEEEKSYRPYTNREKFDYLAEKNPMLRTLQEKLGLDPDL